ncbi:SagB/ThcOx family dehydrogenase [Luteimonas fraxinea]|uniref:SagB/ThcOx family dehydrogenase n=1 Tax=Luteimonas fraxinea TaxID=2901869 RepID=UPI001E391ADD|nr:SagB/ThcOx family dehydrogenase [Luteimonas fraxinea]MCD9126930.1 SagB/ThcOx family dehydrogenase [Luteimonas fraxinea]
MSSSDPDSTFDAAPLFHLFWDNSTLNPSRAQVMHERIAHDAARPYQPPRPLHAAAGVALPAPCAERNTAWLQRRSARAFGSAPWTLDAVAHLLAPLRTREAAGLCDAATQTRLLPSGGGKYPVQAYVALCRVDGPPDLQNNLAWYDPARHALTPVAPCPDWPTLAKTLGVDWAVAPAFVVLLVAEGAGTLAKYGERGGRFLLIEAGVHLGTLGYQAAEAGWAGSAIASFDDDAVLALLGLSAPRHLAMLAYACGPAA